MRNEAHPASEAAGESILPNRAPNLRAPASIEAPQHTQHTRAPVHRIGREEATGAPSSIYCYLRRIGAYVWMRGCVCVEKVISSTAFPRAS